MSPKTLLILNQKSAANADLRALLEEVRHTHSVEEFQSSGDEQLLDELRRAAGNGITRIVAGGGDGTINMVAAALMRLDLGETVELGFLPLGTANDFARGCGDLGGDLSASLERALTARALPTDLGEINGRPFVNVASGGFGAMVTATTPSDLKSRLGGLAYTLHGLSRLGEIRPQRCRFTLDGGTQMDQSVSFMAVGNSRYAGGGFDVAPKAELDDGLLDLSLISHDFEWAPEFLVRELSDPTNQQNEMLVYRTFRECRMEADEPFHINLDGEPIEAERFDIRVLPGAIRMVR